MVRDTKVVRRALRNPGNNDLKNFGKAILQHRDHLLAEWRNAVRCLPAARDLDTPTLNDHIPVLFDELARALAAGRNRSLLELKLQEGPKIHGGLRLRAGFDIVEVVAEYNILRDLLFDFAEKEGIDIIGDPNRILNRVVDRAVALAVDSYAKDKALDVQQRREEHLAFVIHDLRTPLSAIQAAGRILDTSLPGEIKAGRVANMLRILQRNALRLNALVTTASQEQHNLAAGSEEGFQVARLELDLWPLVQALIWDLHALVENAPVEIVNIVPEDCVVNADPALITQVFQNLLSNAIKYTTKGQITIGAEQITPNQIRCWVQDTGAGIPADRLSKVFEKFETDPKKKGGIGLGLAIVKQVVEAHEAQVFVESEVGRGSTFSFVLPGSCPE